MININGKDNTATVSTLPDVWGDLWKFDQPLDFEAFLNSDLLAAKRREMKTIVGRIMDDAAVF